MNNAQKFVQVFGTYPKRKYATKTWWEQEYTNCDDVLKALEQEPKSEWTHDCEILKAYADGAKNVLDMVRADIKDWQVDIHDNEYDADKHDFVFERIFEIIDKYMSESEE